MKMKLSTKIALSIFLVGIIVIGSYIYLVFNGNPLTEHKISLQEKAYAENKYGTKVRIVESDYNFKDGSYQTTLKPAGHPSFLVYQSVQPGGKKDFQDTYPEALWTKELKDKTFPTIKNLFQEAGKIDISVPVDPDYPFKGNKIPSYKQTHKIPFQIDLTVTSNYTKSDNKRIFEMIDFLKKEDFSYGFIFVRYQDKTINIPADDLDRVQSKNDVSNFIL
jgi:hypothetical protein